MPIITTCQTFSVVFLNPAKNKIWENNAKNIKEDRHGRECRGSWGCLNTG